MCGFIFSSLKTSDITRANRYLKLRGPDYTNIETVDQYLIVHNLLSITGKMSIQPFIKQDIVCVYNGQIYNYREYGDYQSDGEVLLDIYWEYGEDFVDYLDGEYAICIYDAPKQKIIFNGDIFKTKPLWYSIENNEIGVSTYKSALEAIGFKDIIEAEPNTIYVYSKIDHTLRKKTIHHFKLEQYKDTYDDWNEAFKESIKKRTAQTDKNIFIGLSSGYDSGAIFCELLKQGVEFKAYSIIGNEQEEIIRKRHTYHNNSVILDNNQRNYIRSLHYIVKNCEPYTNPKYNYEVSGDIGSIGLSFICRNAQQNGEKIYISGQGGDEIFADYGYNGEAYISFSQIKGRFTEDLHDIFPWENFFAGAQQCYIAKEEYVSGGYGIETRYPYLDKRVVQEFLYLTARLKNSQYKSPIHEYLKRNQFPFQLKEKQGFLYFKAR